MERRAIVLASRRMSASPCRPSAAGAATCPTESVVSRCRVLSSTCTGIRIEINAPALILWEPRPVWRRPQIKAAPKHRVRGNHTSPPEPGPDNRGRAFHRSARRSRFRDLAGSSHRAGRGEPSETGASRARRCAGAARSDSTEEAEVRAPGEARQRRLPDARGSRRRGSLS